MAMRHKRKFVKMQSSESSYFYVTVKSSVNTPDKMTQRKFDPKVGKHVKFTETKLS